MKELYNLLEDELSKDIFWARLQYNFEPSLENEIRLYSLTGVANEEDLELRREPQNICNQLTADGKKLFLYGAKDTGKKIGRWLLEQGVDFYAYCARNHEKYVNGVNGKQVFDPSYVFEHPEECCVLVTASFCSEEIFTELSRHHFSEDRIILWTRPSARNLLIKNQYFDFPELFPKGKAFVDAGCCDCSTSKRFAEWCGNSYSKIFAFEPDPRNCQQCQAIADSSNLRLELIPFGLSDKTGSTHFAINGDGSSHIVNLGTEKIEAGFNPTLGDREQKVITVQTAALDDIVQETEIGFIKMDIEGAEFDALHGAKKTILRDKPLLAICVYHRVGDVLAVMDYLRELVPEYHFLLRHYDVINYETVLYASVDRLKNS